MVGFRGKPQNLCIAKSIIALEHFWGRPDGVKKGFSMNDVGFIISDEAETCDFGGYPDND